MICAALACAALWGAMGPARADIVSDVFFEELRRKEQRDEDLRRREPKPDVRLQPEAPAPVPETLPQESVCLSVHRIQLDGLRPEDLPWAQPLADRHLGQCIGAEGITVIVKKLQAEFLARGLITTRVYIPPQNLIEGTLTLKVVPGVIRDIRFADDSGRGSWRTAFPAGPGELLNLRDLEQGLEQMKRVPSQDVEIDIAPGAQPGESDVIVKRKAEKPWRGIVYLDNSGSGSTGRWQGAFTLAWDDMFGFNDLFNVSVNGDARRDDPDASTLGNSLYYSFPYGYWTFILSTSKYEYRRVVQGTNQSFVSSGVTRQSDLRIQRMVLRSASNKTSLQFRLVKGDSRSFVEDAEIENQRRDVTAAEWSVQHRRFLGAATLDASWSYRYGVPWFGAQDDPAGEDSDMPTTRYRLHALEATLTAPFTAWGTGWRYTLNLRGQTTHDVLYGSEHFAIGNRYTVRGFDGEQTLAAERGYVARNELSAALGNSGQEAYFGVDYGRVGGLSAEILPGRSLTGSVLGVRGIWGKSFQYDASAGWVLSKPQGFSTEGPAYAVQASYRF
jgi:hemolysin activation/secretion protein